jgi:hypothetical protein
VVLEVRLEQAADGERVVAERLEVLEPRFGLELVALELELHERLVEDRFIVAELGEQADQVALRPCRGVDAPRGECAAKSVVKEGREVRVTLDEGFVRIGSQVFCAHTN